MEGGSEEVSAAGAMGGVGEVREGTGAAVPVPMAPVVAVAAGTAGVGEHHRFSGDDNASDEAAAGG